MNRKLFWASAALLLFSLTASAQSGRAGSMNQALALYNRGLYERASSILSKIEKPDAVSEGYLVLCSVKTRSDAWMSKVDKYDATWHESMMKSKIHAAVALNLFDDGDYRQAAAWFDDVHLSHLDKDMRAEFLFKQAYSDFKNSDFKLARERLLVVEQLPFNDYTAAARYSIGYIDYSEHRFDSAQQWLTLAADDMRFAEYAAYYILECRFMQGDYAYVMEHGDEVYSTVPQERKSHLARILSEAWLVSGNAAKAKEYYDSDLSGAELKSSKDLFYAGSVSYASGDWQGAIDNFTLMPSRTDSLGQIASYQLADSYLKTRNKVSALLAFKDAAHLRYNPDIREDAFYNYAKLAFDINKDSAPFEEYLRHWSDTRRGDDIYSYIAIAYLYNHDYEAAVAAYDKIDELDPLMRGNYMKANYLRASQLLDGGAWRDAVACLRAASFYTGKNDPFNQMSRYWLAEAYYHTDNLEQAATIYKELYNLSALDGQEEGYAIPYNLAYTYFKGEDYSTAAKWFDNYLASSRKTFRQDALVRRADCDFIRKDYKSAIVAYEKVLAEYSSADDIYPYYQLGLAYGLNGQNSKKIEALSRVEKASTSAVLYSDALYELGRSYVEADKDDMAMACFRKLRNATRDSSFVAKALIELGMVSRNRSEYNEALGYYKQVVQSMPGSVYYDDALAAIESIYQTKGEPEEYFAYVESAGVTSKKSESEKELVYFNSAEQVFLSENYNKALVSLQKYLDAYPDGSKAAEALFYMAESYKSLGQKEKACDYYARVLNKVDEGSFAELSMLNFSELSYSLEHYADAYRGYSSLLGAARLENNVMTAKIGMMRSAYRARIYDRAILSAETLKSDSRCDAQLAREADYVKAKALLATSRRQESFAVFAALSADPSDAIGAESAYLLIQDIYDRGEFDKVEKEVYAFSEKAGAQSYWLAKAFIVLGDSFAEKDNMAQAEATFRSIADGYVPYGPQDDVLDNVNMRLAKIAQMK